MVTNKKGFTLIEILATIFILALIFTFATVGITKILKDSNEVASETTLNSIKKAANIYSYESDAKQWKKSDKYTYDYFCVTVGELINKGLLKKDKIEDSEIDIELNTYIAVSRDKQNKVIKNEEIIGINSTSEASKICTGNVNNEKLNPPTMGNEQSYTDEIHISFEDATSKVENEEINITKKECMYGLSSNDFGTDNEKTGTVNGNVCSITNLKQNTIYYIRICMITDKGSYVCSDTNSYSTKNAIEPEITIGGVINIKYDDSYISGTVGHYFKSTGDGIASSNVSKCTLNGDVFTCGDSVTSIEKNTWYKTSGNEIKVSYSGENKGVVIARIMDKSNNYTEKEKEFVSNKVIFVKGNADKVDGMTTDIEKNCIAEKNEGCKIVAPTFEKIGYTPLGWSTKENATNSIWDIGNERLIREELTFYPISRSNIIYIKYKANGGVLDSPITNDSGEKYYWKLDNDVIFRSEVNKEDNFIDSFHKLEYSKESSDIRLYNYNDPKSISLTRDRYIAVPGEEWICDSGCEIGRKYSQSEKYSLTDFCDSSSGDCTTVLKVNWDFKKYNVNYNCNGGTGTVPATQSKPHDTPITLAVNSCSKPGYTFDGWNTKTDGTGTNYAAGASYTTNAEVTLYAKWTATPYTINYYLGNGTSTAGSTSIGTTSCNYGDSVTLKTWSSFNKTFPNSGNGWLFKHWSNSDSSTVLEKDDGSTFTCTGNLNLYAVGERTFKFYSGTNGAKVGSDQNQFWNPHSTSNSQLSSITIPEPTNISGWTTLGYRAITEATGSPTFTTFGSIIPSATSYTGFVFRTLYSRDLTVSYNGNSNTGGSTTSQTATQYFNSGVSGSGAKVSTVSFALAANGFTRAGYTFNKWALGSVSGMQYAEGVSYSMNPAVTDTAVTDTTKTMYATWTPLEYTITYYLGNGTSTAGSTSIGTSICTYGESCTLKTWASLGKTFPGSSYGWGFGYWANANNSTTKFKDDGESFTYNTAGDVNLYAVGYNQYEFFMGVAPTTPSKPSNAIQYWNPHSTSSSYLTSMVMPEATAITGWTFLGYVGGTNTASSTVHYAASTVGTKVTPAYNSYRGLRAVYSRKLTIAYNANGGSGTVSNQTGTQYYNSGANNGGSVSSVSFTLRANSFTKSGYIFSKWAAGSTSGTQYAAGTSYSYEPGIGTTTTTQTMYAVWNAKPIIIYYNVNGGTIASSAGGYTWSSDSSGFVLSGGSAYSQTIARGGSTSSSGFDNYNNSDWLNISKTGHSAVSGSEWKTSSGQTFSMSSVYSFDQLVNYTSEKDTYYRLDLYVNWKVNTYTITYNANGGSGASSATTYTYASSGTTNLSTTKPTRTGYKFLGWSLDSSASSSSYSAGQAWNLSNASNYTLYAVWDPYYLKVNYYSNYATSSFSGATNSVSSSKNVIVRTYYFYYGTSYPNGLHNYSTSGDGTYLARSGYRTLGFWGTTTSGGTLVHEDESFASGQAIASKFGKNISSGNATLSLYPQWQKVYTLTVNPNSGTWNGSTSSQDFLLVYGEPLTLGTPTRTGYKFDYWDVLCSDADVNEDIFTMGSSNCEVKARWKSGSQSDITAPTLTVTYPSGSYDSPTRSTWDQGTSTTYTVKGTVSDNVSVSAVYITVTNLKNNTTSIYAATISGTNFSKTITFSNLGAFERYKVEVKAIDSSGNSKVITKYLNLEKLYW